MFAHSIRSVFWQTVCNIQFVRIQKWHRQIFWNRNGAPANIVGHRWNANTEAFRQITSYSLGWPSISLFSGPNCPPNAGFGIKSLKNFSGVTPLDPLSGRERPGGRTYPITATRRARGRKLPRCWDLGLGNRSPKSKFTTTPLVLGHPELCFCQVVRVCCWVGLNADICCSLHCATTVRRAAVPGLRVQRKCNTNLRTRARRRQSCTQFAASSCNHEQMLLIHVFCRASVV